MDGAFCKRGLHHGGALFTCLVYKGFNDDITLSNCHVMFGFCSPYSSNRTRRPPLFAGRCVHVVKLVLSTVLTGTHGVQLVTTPLVYLYT